MLTERFRELLTAYVDGELSNRQRRAVLRLLRRSAEARGLLRQLQEDATRLRGLPRQHLAADFPSQVLHTISERGLYPSRRRRARLSSPPMLPAWTGVAIAASVLLLVGASSYLYFAATLGLDQGNGVLAQKNPDGNPLPPGPKEPDDPGTRANDAARPGDAPTHPDPGTPGPAEVVKDPDDKPDPMKPVPDPAEDVRLATPIRAMELFQPKSVDAALPLILKFGNLDVARLRDEFQKDSGFRLEVPCHESARAFERLQGACKAHNVGLLIEQVAQARLKQPKLHTNFVVYAEDLTPDDLVKLLRQAADDDKKAEAKRKGDGQLDGLVVTRMSKEDREELSKLLGVDPKQVQTSPGLDPKTPLSELTAKQVEQALTGQGTSRADTAKAVAKSEQTALVMPYNPARPRQGSAEVKRFLDGRKPPRAGTVQVLLVLRETAG